MAKPIPENSPVADLMAEFTPITSPRRFNKGPPEFPGFIAASVWITSGIENPLVSERGNNLPN